MRPRFVIYPTESLARGRSVVDVAGVEPFNPPPNYGPFKPQLDRNHLRARVANEIEPVFEFLKANEGGAWFGIDLDFHQPVTTK